MRDHLIASAGFIALGLWLWASTYSLLFVVLPAVICLSALTYSIILQIVRGEF